MNGGSSNFGIYLTLSTRSYARPEPSMRHQRLPKTLRAWVAMRSILYSTLPHPLLRSTFLFHLPERVLDHLAGVEGVYLASEAASEVALEAPRTSVIYYREDRGIDKAENVCDVCCGSTVGREASHGSGEEASGLSPQSVQTILAAYISVSFKISQAMD